MKTEIMKKVEELCKFLPDEYSFKEHIKEDPHKDLGILRSISKEQLMGYFSLYKDN